MLQNLPQNCTGFHLSLRNPMFINDTLSIDLIPRMRIPIHDLAIHGGNLQHFPANAFLNQYAASIKTLALSNLTIKTWTRNSLVGLSNLEEIYIKKCNIGSVHSHIMRPVRHTLTFLTITKSNQWNPANVTGATTLAHTATVDFSHNIFVDLLGGTSFTGLRYCRVLYLNSCKISAIGYGAFNNLRSIETLYLNNNYLITVPTGLFNNILSITGMKPRINLQGNLWQCDCSAREIRQLVKNDMLLTDPVCNSPPVYNGKSFTDFDSYCDESENSITDLDPIVPPIISVPAIESTVDIADGFVYVNNSCYNGQENSTNTLFQMMSPVYDRQCSSQEIYKMNISSIPATRKSGQISDNGWIKFTFILKTNTSSMVQITAADTTDYGILWYQSTCPNEVYCVNTMPAALRVYNVDMTAQYIFCPILTVSGSIDSDNCVFYNLATTDNVDFETHFQILFYVCTGAICLVLGATCVYSVVRKHPNLLKGSKRILFVKHKTVDALVLPPKVPLRKDLENEVPPEFNDKKIFIVSANSYGTGKFNRNKSTRSSKSNAPSYISALQPTEEQLAEWRIQNHFTNDPTPELATYSWICSAESFQYMDVIDNDKTYESLK